MLKARGGILAAIAAMSTAVLYGRAWRFDLQCDDLLVIRPWSKAELLAVWHGTWEPSGAFAVFFRPLASWFYAGTFELFGWNAPAHMLLSLAMLALVAWLIALFVMRESGSALAGAVAAGLYAVHPNVPWSTGTWITNDFHKLTAISALCALLLWQRLRHRPPAHWMLLAPFAVICFLIKEDGLMLIPALVSMQWARARLVGDVRAPSLRVVASAALGAVALVAWRSAALGELGGFDLPASANVVLHNLARGPVYAFTLHGSLSVLTIFEKILAVVVFVFVALGIVLMPREKRSLPVTGLILIFWYDLPLALISNVMRYYMLTIGAVMVIVPACMAWASRPVYRWVAAVPIAMLLIARGGMQSQASELAIFEPCGSAERNCVSWVLEEVKTLPPQARAFVADTPRACAAAGRRPRIGDAGTLTWGLGATSIDTDTGERSHPATGGIVSLVRTSATSAVFSVRHPLASATQPVRMEISANGVPLTQELTTPEWTTFDVPLTEGLRTWLRAAHRIDAVFSAPGGEWRQR